MRYYSIQNSGDLKIIGKYPQTKSINYNCHIWDEPKFIEHVHFTKIDFEPIIANAILHPKSKKTDLINTNSAMGFSNKLLISGKLKKILLDNRNSGMQFFRAPIIQNNRFEDDYWILNMYLFNNEYIDFAKSMVIHEKKAEDYRISFKTIKEQIYCDNFEDFETTRLAIWSSKEESIYIETLVLYLENIKEDFFTIRYVFGKLFFVSEKLKKEIEDAGCTGIEFQPIELTYNEWTAPGGEREKVYGKM